MENKKGLLFCDCVQSKIADIENSLKDNDICIDCKMFKNLCDEYTFVYNIIVSYKEEDKYYYDTNVIFSTYRECIDVYNDVYEKFSKTDVFEKEDFNITVSRVGVCFEFEDILSESTKEIRSKKNEDKI